MKERMVVIGIDDICKIFKDYAYMAGFPQDAIPVKLQWNKGLQKFRLMIESGLIDGPQPDETINFSVQRSFLVG
jgi:hypothetical protein